MKRILIAIVLMVSITGTNLVLAATNEAATAEVKAPGFWTEVDITFWQTAPFMIFWGYVIDQQLSAVTATAGVPHWELILPAAAVISFINAYNHAGKVTEK